MTALPDGSIEAFLEKYEQRELLRFLTCGSVDDGKSTLIGRLLHDSSSVYDDQLRAVRKDTLKHGTTGEEIDFALLVDGLEAEREQGITIDVAYRYFSTPRRKFIIADTPGHEQYTRNMATGASTCHLAVILVDARKGVLSQTRRHSFIAALLGIKHLVVAVNKMDLVDYSQERFEEIRSDFSDFAAKLQVTDIEFIPMSALRGENVVHSGAAAMPWYRGRPLLDYLENVHIASDVNLIDLRFPVQYVVRPDPDFRGYAGTLASGIVRRGDELAVFPSGRRARVRSILGPDGDLDEAFAPLSVALVLDAEVDVSRGDTLAHPNNAPAVAREIEAMVVWMHEEPLRTGGEYLLKHGTVQTPAVVTGVRYRVNVNTVHRENADRLELNEIGRLRIDASRPLAHDPYEKNRWTGAFILIDRITNATLAAGMILDREAATEIEAGPVRSAVTSGERNARLGQEPLIIWIEGEADTSETAFALEQALFRAGWFAVALAPRQGRHAFELAVALGAVVIAPSALEIAEPAVAAVRLHVSAEGWSLDGESIGSGADAVAGALAKRGLPRKAGGR